MDKTFLAIKLLVIKQQIEQLQETQREIENELIELLSEEKSIDLGDAKITRVESNRVYYDIDKMRSIFDKESLNKLCIKEISVDKAELRELFMRKPEFKKILSSVLKVSYNPDDVKIKQAVESGELTHDEIRNFASVKTSVYIKTNKKERKEDDG